MSDDAETVEDAPETADTAQADTAEADTADVPADAFLDVELSKIVQEYPKPDGEGVHRVLDEIDLSFHEPTINMLLGPSGCGKSTLLRMIGGVRPIGVKSPTSGSVIIGGQPCEGAHDESVMVFQRYANRPDLTVRENVAFPFRLKLWKSRVPKAEQEKRVTDMLQAVGLGEKGDLRPSQLSGGQNQRVALARALVLRPRIILMDEPFGALDAQTREEMQRLLIDLWRAQKCLIVFVTHDVTEALLLGDRVIVLSSSPAKVVDDFTIDEPRPRSDAWLMSTHVVQMKDRVLERLHGAASGHGQVRVSF
ncbi:MAG: ABC transporter ATP-binding protein [Myxococcota bacterium]